MRIGFILYTSLRYFRARKKSKGLASSVLSIIGVAVGVMALTGVIGVMNGFQLTYINNILEISSYHLQIIHKDGLPLDSSLENQIAEIDEIISLVPFTESQVLIEGYFSKPCGGLIRGVPENILDIDPGFRECLFAQKSHSEADIFNEFNIREKGSVVIGYMLAGFLKASKGDTIFITTVADIGKKDQEGARKAFIVGGIFKSGYAEIDESLVFMSLEDSALLLGGQHLRYGIKLKNRFNDREIEARIKALLNNNEYSVISWREFNKGFFGALLMEKLTMMLLVGLIFIVVGFNIFNSLRRMVYERLEEIGVLKALGAPPRDIQAIFIIEGFLIGFLGALLGLILGLIVANHINEIFAIFESLVNEIISIVEIILKPIIGPQYLGRVTTPFSPRIFYLEEVPSKVIYHEALIIFLFALLSATGAALLASKRVSLVKPAVVLRYE